MKFHFLVLQLIVELYLTGLNLKYIETNYDILLNTMVIDDEIACGSI